MEASYQSHLFTCLKDWLAPSQGTCEEAVLNGLPILLQGFVQQRLSSRLVDSVSLGNKRKADAMASSRRASLARAQFFFGLRLWDLATQGLLRTSSTTISAEAWGNLVMHLKVGKALLTMVRDQGIYHYDVDTK